MEDSPTKDDGSPRVLEALKQASHDLQTNPRHNSDEFNSAAIRALLELGTESEPILSKDPNLSTLSLHLADLKTLIQTLQKSRSRNFIRSFLTRRATTHSVSRVASSIESEIQAWIDRESIENLTEALEKEPLIHEADLITLLTQFENRLSQGFNRELQYFILKSKLFSLLESILCFHPENFSMKIREHAAAAIRALIFFNKDVFVGQVLMGSTVKALIRMASANSMRVLCSLIRLIKSPLVDEIEANGEIAKIISLLSSSKMEMKIVGLDCVLEIGYFGRKEAVEAMIEEGVVEKLVDLQRSEMGGDLIEMGEYGEGEEEEERESEEKGFKETRPFASCVARFAVQLEVGEGLRQREKRAFKQEILIRVREASVSEAQAATIIAEVLWGSSP